METFIPKGNVRGFIMPDFVFKDSRLSLGAKVLYPLLCKYAGENDHCWPSHERLARDLDCSVSTVKVYLKLLADCGYIVAANLIKHRVRSCMYFFLTNNVPYAVHKVSAPIFTHSQKSAIPQPESGYNYNLKEFKNTYPPLPPKVESQKLVHSTGLSHGGASSACDADFEAFFAAYPNKQGKERAHAAWNTLRKYHSLPTLSLLQDAVFKAQESEQWQKASGKYIPMACNFLRWRQWEDIPSVKASSAISNQVTAHNFSKYFEQHEQERKGLQEKITSALRPAYETLASKFNVGVNGVSFGLWSLMHQKGIAPSSKDLPPSTDGVHFLSWLKTYQRNAVYAQ